MSLPNFLIVGASKAGTTSLWNYLNQHPDIYLPLPKETLYFIRDIHNQMNPRDPGAQAVKHYVVQTLGKYKSLFVTEEEFKLKGEATASYLYYFKSVIPQINELLGNNVKIIIILREPISKIISHYKFYRGKGWEALSFDKALKNEKWRIENNYNAFFHYSNQGYYFDSVKAYIENFQQVHICFYDDLKDNPQGLLDGIFDFLNVPKVEIERATKVYNKSYIPKNFFLHKVIKIIGKKTASFDDKVFKKLKKILKKQIISINEKRNFELTKEQTQKLKKVYRDDIEKLSSLIGVDLIKRWRY